MYKQCKLRIGNIYTYKWVNEKIAKENEVVKVKKIINENEIIKIEWIICKIYHVKQNKKFLSYIHLVD